MKVRSAAFGGRRRSRAPAAKKPAKPPPTTTTEGRCTFASPLMATGAGAWSRRFADSAQHSPHHREVADLHEQHRAHHQGAGPLVDGVEPADQPGPTAVQGNEAPGPAPVR